MRDYNKDHCWQYDIRIKNLEGDLKDAGLTLEYIKELRVHDFDYVAVTSDKEKKKIIEFIKRHEWLGTISQYTTNWFACYHNGIMCGAILFNTPNTFSKMIGEETKGMERLISRGACISWSPKNLASNFMMWCIKQMVLNTPYRLFSAYSDPEAKELGTIYQACNFFYLGQKFGTKNKYLNPYTGKFVSDRAFRQKTFYKKIAKEFGIEWGKDWNHPKGMNWHNIPDNIEHFLRMQSNIKLLQSECKRQMPKHKYVMVMGSNKGETRKLRKEFLERNKIYKYPKHRGK